MINNEQLCACGCPLHYNDPDAQRFIEQIIEWKGPLILVTSLAGAWRVPRHYIALHGLKEEDLPSLAIIYGWEQVRP